MSQNVRDDPKDNQRQPAVLRMPCCCLARSECVLAVSIYGVATSVALLSVLGLHGHDFGPGFSPFTTEILHQVCLATYAVTCTYFCFITFVFPI